MIEGITKSGCWRGPYVLKSRAIAIGMPYALLYAETKASAASLLAAYGSRARTGWPSSIGMYIGVPYTWAELTNTSFSTDDDRLIASRTVNVPDVFVSNVWRGFSSARPTCEMAAK